MAERVYKAHSTSAFLGIFKKVVYDLQRMNLW